MYSGYYGTFIAHIFSLISAIWSLIQLQTCMGTIVGQLLFTAFFTVFANSFLSLLRYGLADGYRLRKLHVLSLNISTLGFFMLVFYVLLIVAKFRSQWFVLPFINFIPLYSNVHKMDYRSKRKRSDSIVILNCLVFSYMAIYAENYNAVAFIISFLFGYIYVGDCGYFLDTEVPSIDIYQYIQCFLCLFTVNAFCL